MKLLVPPIKSQGIKTKLVRWIKSYTKSVEYNRWIEPFVGSGVVGFNIKSKKAVFCDTNPHIINFYCKIKDGVITPGIARYFLESEGGKLSKYGDDYYYEVRERFNKNSDPLDFLFLNRSCFNGVIRFNSKGIFNVPFCHKTERFSKSYITKIINQIENVYNLTMSNDWEFVCQDFHQTLCLVDENDFVYCDPPYVGRHVDYYNSWDGEKERELYEKLKSLPSKFILSTWHSNEHRINPYIKSFWSDFNIFTTNHFYHVGAKELNRKPMLEALVLNYEPAKATDEIYYRARQQSLFNSNKIESHKSK